MDYQKRIVGTKDFGSIIDVTDPGYDKDTWCRMNDIQIRPGKYSCITWETKLNKNDSRVAIIGIYLEGKIPKQDSMKYIGNIGVDAGLAGFFENKPDYNDKEWSEFCQSISDGNAWIKPEGFFSSSGYGDGVYDVFAGYTLNKISSLEIRFDI